MFLFHPIDLPKLKITPTYEERFRFERRIDRDFYETTNDNRSDLHTRVRVGAKITSDSEWSGTVQFQYTHNAIWAFAKNKSAEFRDVTLANAQRKTKTSTTTIGRQKIDLGSQRLIGPLEWSPTSRTFDGIRHQQGPWDVFGFAIPLNPTHVYDARVIGVSHKDHYGDMGLIHKTDKIAAGSINHTTVFRTVNKKVGQTTYDFEGAAQFGKWAGRDMQTWAYHVMATQPVSEKTKVFVEVNAASGGSATGTMRTFDNLYPTNHKFYGSMDLLAWKNMNEFAIGVQTAPTKKTDIKLSYRVFSLRDKHDGWYGAAGGLNKGVNGNFVDATGASGNNLGSEIDLEYTMKMNKNSTIIAGLSTFNPGGFVDKRSNNNAKTQYWGYVGFEHKF